MKINVSVWIVIYVIFLYGCILMVIYHILWFPITLLVIILSTLLFVREVLIK